jgi:hypothetical protein
LSTKKKTAGAEVADEDHVPNEVLAKLKKVTSETGRANAVALKGSAKEHILMNAMAHVGDEGVYLVHT